MSIMKDPKFEKYFAEMKEGLEKDGLKAMKKLENDPEFMKMLGEAVGDLPSRVLKAKDQGLPEEAALEKEPVKVKSNVIKDAVMKNDVGAIENLLADGKDPNEADEDGRTALHFAAGAGHEKMVAKLIEAGAETEIADTQGTTALYFAAGYGHKEVLAVLLDAGASPTTLNAAGQAPRDAVRMNPKNPIAKDPGLMARLGVQAPSSSDAKT